MAQRDPATTSLKLDEGRANICRPPGNNGGKKSKKLSCLREIKSIVNSGHGLENIRIKANPRPARFVQRMAREGRRGPAFTAARPPRDPCKALHREPRPARANP